MASSCVYIAFCDSRCCNTTVQLVAQPLPPPLDPPFHRPLTEAELGQWDYRVF